MCGTSQYNLMQSVLLINLFISAMYMESMPREEYKSGMSANRLPPLLIIAECKSISKLRETVTVRVGLNKGQRQLPPNTTYLEGKLKTY